MKRSRQQKPHNVKGEAGQLIKESLIGGGIGLALVIATVLISPFAMLSFSAPNALALPFAAVAVLLGGASGSAYSANRYKDAPIAAGMISSGIIAIPLVIASFFIPQSRSLFNTAIISASLIGGSIAGSVSIAKIASDRKRNMKRAMKRR